MGAAELDPTSLSEEHIGFVLGPRLNAAGRLADANACVDLLTTGDIGRARILAADLEALNARRKLLCNQVEQGAEAQIARDPSLLEGGALVLANPAWPAGIIGIVASRLVEKYGKPAVLIASPPGEVARASARSVAGVNITAALAAHADLLVNFGGHPMAAGFGIDPERIPELRRALSRTAAAMLADAHVETGTAHRRHPAAGRAHPRAGRRPGPAGAVRPRQPAADAGGRTSAGATRQEGRPQRRAPIGDRDG